jgi:hypothetical protein
MKRMIMRTMGALVLSLTLVSPLAAEDSSCYDYWIKKCDHALEDANWAEKVAIGAYCTAMLASCSVKNITIKVL